MKTPFFAALCLLLALFSACRKPALSGQPAAVPVAASSFKEFVILKGEHYTTDNAVKQVETDELKFVVRFDSSAVYQTANPTNQYDINKLYGFSDNGQHHQQFSARFGWRWSDGALRLFAYTYNHGLRTEKELSTAAIGNNVFCSIKVAGEVYVFTVNGKVENMPRLSTTPKANGYRLYPYFGGDETAPHEVHIWIKEE